MLAWDYQLVNERRLSWRTSEILGITSLDQIATGVSGLDEVLHGSLPKGRTILVVGSPGSGKATFAVQFLAG